MRMLSVPIYIRQANYEKLRKASEKNGKTIGQIINELIEENFQFQLLKFNRRLEHTIGTSLITERVHTNGPGESARAKGSGALAGDADSRSPIGLSCVPKVNCSNTWVIYVLKFIFIADCPQRCKGTDMSFRKSVCQSVCGTYEGGSSGSYIIYQ